MRNTILTTATLFLSGALTAQGVFSNKTQSILEKVIQDYPNHFYNIKGEQVSQVHQTVEYRSIVQLPGSPSCLVVKTADAAGSAANEAYSWTCMVLESDSFDKVRERFHDIYGQISNSIISSGKQKTFILTGQYEEPDADRKLTKVMFSLLPGVGDMKSVRVELSLRHDGKGYKILLSVNDHTTQDMQGAVTASNQAPL